MPSINNRHLQSQIDLISVPVFVADECADGDFRIVAINLAHARVTGLDQRKVQGRTPLEILNDPESAGRVVRHYKDCVETDRPVSYREILTFRGVPMVFDTTLHKIPLAASGRFRVVGTALNIEAADSVGNDIDFYVALARNSLMTIEMMMSATKSGHAPSISEREATRILCTKALLSLDEATAVAKRLKRSTQEENIGLTNAVRDFILH